jgi:small GTP-binding protein
LDRGRNGAPPAHEGKKTMIRTLKVIVGGEGNVGKTSLIRQYAKGKFSEARNLTLGIDITTHEFNVEGEAIKLALWDIEGQAGNRPNFYLGAQASMLVYDVSEPMSLKSLLEWVERCRKYCPDAPLLIIGNKLDLGEKVPAVWGEKLAQHVRAYQHGRVSAKTGERVTWAFEMLARMSMQRALTSINR